MITSIYKLLSDETRLRVIFLLYQQEFCVCELSGILEVPQPKVSKVLSKLRDMDLVDDHRKEKFVFYQLKKSNPLLVNSMDYLNHQVMDYPQLQLDQSRIKNKDSFLDACSLISLKELERSTND